MAEARPTGELAVTALPSIRTRLLRWHGLWTLLGVLSVGVAVWLATLSEVDELLDEAQQSGAELMVQWLSPLPGRPAPWEAAPPGAPSRVLSQLDMPEPRHFAWQVVDAQGQVLLHSKRAGATPWHTAPVLGFSDVAGWRVYGQPLATGALTLYAAHTQDERLEAKVEVAQTAVLAALAVGLIGWLGLRHRLQAEMRPLHTLSQHVAQLDLDAALRAPPGAVGASTGLGVSGAAQREELAPLHAAIDALSQRLLVRVQTERAFSAHAAHALRTPLAGMETQLAVAQQEAERGAPMQPRLHLLRQANARLQTVVSGLLALFRAGAQVHPQALPLVRLHAELTQATAGWLGLSVVAQGDGALHADPDVLLAALVNLLDNAQRAGATAVHLSMPQPLCLCVQDDGPGVAPQRLEALQTELRQQTYGSPCGLGLLLADQVARAHGGEVRLRSSRASVFPLEMWLGPLPAPASPQQVMAA